jgi:hypothetical protein
MSAQLQVTGEAKIRDIQGPVVADSGVITALDGAANQYVRGDGTLAIFPTSAGGGSSVSYYLNGSVNQGTFSGSTYYQMSKDAITGTGTNFSTSTNGLIAQFITDANDPDVVSIPSGNWNIEFYMGVSASSGSLASFYVEIYKYDGSAFTLIATNVATPEFLTNTTTVDAYFTSVAMPTTALALTDRLAVKIYANVASKTVTLYTEDNRLCQIVTTFSKGILSINNLTDQSQNLTVGTSGTNFAIVSSGDTHTFNLPVASDTNTGKLSSTDWVIFNNKQDFLTDPVTGTGNTNYVPLFTGTSTIGNSIIYQDGVKIGIMNASPTTTLDVIGGGNFSGSIGALSFIKSGGTSSQFLKADGSVDSNTYLTTSSAASTYVPYTGATTFVNLGTQLFYSGGVAVENAGNGLISTDGSLSAGKGIFLTNTISGGQWSSGTTNLVARNSGFLITRSAGGGLLIFDSAVTYDYTFPSSNGTIALTSNLSSYLPLSGGTLTGALSGTSATFSGGVTSNATTSVSFYSGTYVSNTLGDGSFATYSGRIRENASYALNIDLYDRTAATWRTPLSFNNTGGAATFSSSVTAAGTASTPTFWAKGGMDGSGTGKGNIRSSDSGGSNYFDFGRDNLTTGNFVLTSNGGSPLLSVTTSGAATFSAGITAGSGTSSGYATLNLIDSGTGSARYASIRKNYDSPFDLRIRASNSDSAAPIVFDLSNAVEAMRITSGGNVLMNTTQNSMTGGFTDTTLLIKQKADGGAGGGLQIEANGSDNIAFFGFDGSAFKIGTSYRSSGSYQPITFSTAGSERLRVTSGGQLVVGGTSSIFQTSGRGVIEVNGSSNSIFGLAAGGVEKGYVYHSGSSMYLNQSVYGGQLYAVSYGNGVYLATNATSWTSASDERLKDINGTIENAVDKLKTLRAVNFSWKKDDSKKENLGLIAQEVEKVFPQVVDKNKLPSKADEVQTDETEYLGVRYQELVPVLIAAIQEQQVQIEELKAKIK